MSGTKDLSITLLGPPPNVSLPGGTGSLSFANIFSSVHTLNAPVCQDAVVEEQGFCSQTALPYIIAPHFMSWMTLGLNFLICKMDNNGIDCIMLLRRLTEVIYIKQGLAHSKCYVLTLSIVTVPLESAKLDREPTLRVFERLTWKKAA